MSEGTTVAPAPDKTVYRGIACGGTGGDPVAIDSRDGRLIRFRPMRWDAEYSAEELKDSWWEIEVDGKKLTPPIKDLPNYFALAYKSRVYSKNRVKHPLKRVDWEPGGDPAKTNPQNRGISKFKRISWDEALDIIEAELRRVIDSYGAYSVLCIGEDGHRESKDLHAGGGMHATLMNQLGGYTRETRTPDSVEGWYWGAKHFWGAGCNHGLGMPAPPETNFNPWNTALDVTRYSDFIVFQAGDLELTQNYASQWFSYLLNYWEELGKDMVVVDPFCNYTAVCHENMKWIPILPNTDAALDFAIMHVWLTEGLYDAEYVETHSVGFEKVKAYILGTDEEGIAKTPAWAAPLCGVPAWTIKALARKWGKSTTALANYSSGAVKGPYSHEPGRTAAYKLGMQGLGKPGIQHFYMNAADLGKWQAARSTTAPFLMATKSRMFVPVPQTLPRTGIAKAIEDGEMKWWGSPAIVYVENAEQFKEYNYPAPAEAGGTKCHLLWSEKPCTMNCWNGGFSFQQAIRSPEVECFITNHQWIENDSFFADLILPVTTCVEERDSVGGSSIVDIKFAGMPDRACDIVGESMSDYQIAIEIAKRFGVDENITLGMTEEEWLQYAVENSPIAGEVSYEELSQKGYYVPKIDPNWQDMTPGMRNFYEDPEQFPLDTPTGKLEFWSDALANNFPDDPERLPMATWFIGGPASEGWTHDETRLGERAKAYPLLLVANPARFRVHVQGDDIPWFREIETAKVKGPDGYLYEPVWFAPEDAQARGIANGDIVKVFNERGIILAGARISERIQPGAVMINKGSRVDPIAPGIDRGGAANLISPANPVSKHCWGFAVTGYLCECAKLEQGEHDDWKAKYPDAFARDYDPAIGMNYASWVED
jgi:trimethylamine-N-oxide reductase (cytochrome c)